MSKYPIGCFISPKQGGNGIASFVIKVSQNNEAFVVVVTDEVDCCYAGFQLSY